MAGRYAQQKRYAWKSKSIGNGTSGERTGQLVEKRWRKWKHSVFDWTEK